MTAAFKAALTFINLKERWLNLSYGAASIALEQNKIT